MFSLQIQRIYAWFWSLVEGLDFLGMKLAEEFSREQYQSSDLKSCD